MIARALMALLFVCGGCGGKHLTAKNYTVADAIPPGAVAAPWLLDGDVWTGTIDAAARGLGEDTETWGRFEPGRVWLAVYQHETRTDRRMTVRVFSFPSTDDARRAYEFHLPQTNGRPFDIGDGGTWTDLGVLFVWGRLVFEIFGDRSTTAHQLQSAYVAGVIEKRMPADLPEAPQ